MNELITGFLFTLGVAAAIFVLAGFATIVLGIFIIAGGK